MFRPPVNRAMRVLDRSFFNKTFPISAARIFEMTNISKCVNELVKSGDRIDARQIQPVQPDPFPDQLSRPTKCLLLRPGIKHDDPSSWSETVRLLVESQTVAIIPYELHLNYDYWTAHEILAATLPEEVVDEFQTGFALVGHIAHMNIRDEYLPYKSFIAQVVLSKNPTVRTVINKVEQLGPKNQFRVLDYEVLAGENNLLVEHKELQSKFRFDYSKVFWNSRLFNEHQRLTDGFVPGEAVCDVMAGVGPFAIPAAKRGIFVFANDLNTHCYESLKDAIEINNVDGYVRAFNEDGHTFIPNSARNLLKSELRFTVETKTPKKVKRKDRTPRPSKVVTWPQTFSHYVMNLPDTAIDFLPAFIGLYTGHEHLFEPFTREKLPLIHVYCFAAATKRISDVEVHQSICKRVSQKIEFDLGLDTPELEIHEVRDVAPNKCQFCVTFRLPREVAFFKS